MPLTSLNAAAAALGARRLLLSALCALALALLLSLLPAHAEALAAGAPVGLPLAVTVKPPDVSASLEECTTASVQAEREAIFAGEMSAIPGSARMEMRIDLLERGPGEVAFHAVVAPGLGVWRTSAPGVNVYKYFKRVTDLSAPAVYRGAVRFRWLNAKGRFMRADELRTPRCAQAQQTPAAAETQQTPSAAAAQTPPAR